MEGMITLVPFDFDPTFFARGLDVTFLQNFGADGTKDPYGKPAPVVAVPESALAARFPAWPAI